MKRFYILLALLLCAMMAFGAQAETYSPGDEVQIPIYVSSSDAHQVTLKLKVDSALEFVSIKSSYGQGVATQLALFDINNPLNGQVATMTCKIKADAKSGTYGIQVNVLEAWTLDEDKATASASAGTVTVFAVCKHAQTEEKVTKEATCDATGTKQVICSDCGEVISTETIAKLGHNFVTYTESKAPTCTEKGKETAKCERCDKTDTRDIPALGHDVADWTVTKEPTCTEKGIEESKCTRCGEGDTREIPALGHEEGEWKVTKEPTCTEKGIEESECTRCGESATREIPALGHDVADWKVTKEPTCTEKGEETATCSRCDKVDTREIPALGHDVGEWKVTKPATCDEKGEETATCARCGKTDTREIPALGHDIGEWVVTKEATCTEDGAKYRECSRCDKREDVVILALGHNGVWKVIKPATGKEEGLKQKICKRCGEVLEEAVIPVLQIESRTACTAGIKASELVNLKADYDWWKMVTAIDLSVEGTTRYPLVAGNVYEIGYVEITVEEGVVTADMVVDAPTVTMYTNALIFLADPSEITFFDANFYEHYEFPATINVEDLPAEQVYMMVCSQLTIDLSKPEPKYYNFKGAEHAALVEQVNAIIAEMNAAE